MFSASGGGGGVPPGHKRKMITRRECYRALLSHETRLIEIEPSQRALGQVCV